MLDHSPANARLWSRAGYLSCAVSQFALAAMVIFGSGALHAQSAQPSVDRTILPIPRGAFGGVMGHTPEDSIPAWPRQAVAPAGAPNVLLVMTDDVGFGASSAFGGPIPTPNLERLASMGLRYTNFHTTGVCSPSRAALLTGRNHHSVGAGELADSPSGFPGYDGFIPQSAATIARILTGNGYSTAFIGKHHNVPPSEASAAGPFDQWPTGLGFEYFYGFIGGDVDQWHPRLFRGTSQAEEAATPSGDLLDKRLTDDALSWIHNQKAAAPDKPFFLYYASGTGHAPHQAPKDWIARFKGKFDQGWDKLRLETFQRQKAMGIIPADTDITPRPEQIPAWDSLSPEMKQVNARYLEVYAAQLAYHDAQFGRILDELQRMGQLDNTLVIFIEGDNGATAQNGLRPSENEIGDIANRFQQTDAQFARRIDLAGGPDTYECYAAGWAYALNAPFPWFKHIASHLGATRNGMVVAWPAQIRQGGQIRSLFAHISDVLPTILNASHIPAPSRVDGVEQQPFSGIGLDRSFTDPNADNHRTQYFELAGNRAIYHDGWMASTTPLRMPWERGGGTKASVMPQWSELYDMRRDFTQSHNLAGQYPDKLKELAAIWDGEARRDNVYPVDPRPNGARAMESAVTRLNRGRTRFTYWGRDVSVSQGAAPSLSGAGFTVAASVDIASSRADGPLLTIGSKFGGWGFYLRNGRPVAVEATSELPSDLFRVEATRAVKAGKSLVSFDFKREGGVYTGGTLTISINGETVAEGRMPKTIVSMAGIGETMDVGRDTGVAVADEYGTVLTGADISRVDVTIVPGGFGATAARSSGASGGQAKAEEQQPRSPLID